MGTRKVRNAWELIRGAFLAVVTGLAFLSFLLSIYGLYLERHRLARGYSDFIIFYTGAQILRDGRSTDLYNLELQQNYQSKFDVEPRQGAVLPFNHPPFELLWHLPLNYFNYAHAYLLWCVVNVLLLIAVGRYLVPLKEPRLAIMFWLMIFGFYPVLAAFMQGQDSLLLTFLIVASMYALKNQREVAAGIILAFGLFKPQVVLVFTVVFLVGRDVGGELTEPVAAVRSPGAAMEVQQEPSAGEKIDQRPGAALLIRHHESRGLCKR